VAAEPADVVLGAVHVEPDVAVVGAFLEVAVVTKPVVAAAAPSAVEIVAAAVVVAFRHAVAATTEGLDVGHSPLDLH